MARQPGPLALGGGSTFDTDANGGVGTRSVMISPEADLWVFSESVTSHALTWKWRTSQSFTPPSFPLPRFMPVPGPVVESVKLDAADPLVWFLVVPHGTPPPQMPLDGPIDTVTPTDPGGNAGGVVTITTGGTRLTPSFTGVVQVVLKASGGTGFTLTIGAEGPDPFVGPGGSPGATTVAGTLYVAYISVTAGVVYTFGGGTIVSAQAVK